MQFLPLRSRLIEYSFVSGRREVTCIQRHAGRQVNHRHLQLRGEANTANQCGLRRWVHMMRLAETDSLSGIKAQFEGWAGPKMNDYWSLRRMAQSGVTMICRAILRSLHWEM